VANNPYPFRPGHVGLGVGARVYQSQLRMSIHHNTIFYSLKHSSIAFPAPQPISDIRATMAPKKNPTRAARVSTNNPGTYSSASIPAKKVLFHDSSDV
jgi:hypothetical protein